jgi:3-oxoacyl-[acyl-carrier-protein] synthase II
MKRVVITGLGVISPIGLTLKETWPNVLAGNSGVDRIASFDPGRLPVQIAAEVRGFNPETIMDAKEARRTTRFIQMAVAAAKEALIDSGIDTQTVSERIGCSIGVGIGAIEFIHNTVVSLVKDGPKRISPFFIPFSITNMAAGMVANTFNLKGPNICSATACSSGTHAIGEAFLYIKNNMADMMVCGGSESAICEIAVGGFANMKALSRQNENPRIASRPFDRDRDGFVMGEGSGILVLEEYEHARARGAQIYAELLGFGMSGDAYHISSPPPEGEGAQRCMAAALRSAGLNPEQISYINAHGTSTLINDIFESEAILKVFGNSAHKLMVSSTKGVTGHCLGAAGGIEAVFLAKAIASSTVPPTANLENPDPKCTLDYVPREARSLAINYGMSNSFGFGGTNASLVMGSV